MKEQAKRVESTVKKRPKRVDSLVKNGFKPLPPYPKIFSKLPFDRQSPHLSDYTKNSNLKVTENLQDDFPISNFEVLGSNPATCNLFSIRATGVFKRFC